MSRRNQAHGWLTPQEAADALRVSIETIYRWCRAGWSAARRVGPAATGSWRISAAGISAPPADDEVGR